MNEELKKQAKAIGSELMSDANTAGRIGEMISDIADEADEISRLSHDSIKNSNEFLNEYLDEINGVTIPGGTIVQKLKATLNSKTAIKQAIHSKKVDMSDHPKLADYAERIGSIRGTAIWSPNPTWWDIKSIIQDATNQEYTYKTIQLLLASDISTTFTGGVAYKTSDGKYYPSASATHTWDRSKDKQCIENGEETYKTRWLITYHSSQDIEMRYIPKTCLYFVMDGVLPTAVNFGNTDSGEALESMINSFDMINGANFTKITDFSQMFISCYLLKLIPQIDTSNGTNFSKMFASCYALKHVPLLDTSKGTDFDDMFVYCLTLTSIPPLDTSSGTSFDGMFSACLALTSIPPLDTSKSTNFRSMFAACPRLASIPPLDTSQGTLFSDMFNGCISLKSIPSLDVAKNTDWLDAIFSQCNLLEYINISNLSTYLNLSDSKILSRISLLYLIDNLVRVTTARTLTLGEANLSKLTAAEKAIATNKGWTLA